MKKQQRQVRNMDSVSSMGNRATGSNENSYNKNHSSIDSDAERESKVEEGSAKVETPDEVPETGSEIAKNRQTTPERQTVVHATRTATAPPIAIMGGNHSTTGSRYSSNLSSVRPSPIFSSPADAIDFSGRQIFPKISLEDDSDESNNIGEQGQDCCNNFRCCCFFQSDLSRVFLQRPLTVNIFGLIAGGVVFESA